VGFYRGKELLFAARVRAGFVPATRREVFSEIKGLKISKCPFVNLLEIAPGRWGQGLTVEKMKSCIWVEPAVVVRIDFAEWTGADKLRHTKFFAIRDDKDLMGNDQLCPESFATGSDELVNNSTPPTAAATAHYSEGPTLVECPALPATAGSTAAVYRTKLGRGRSAAPGSLRRFHFPS
jgi:hypothetical protein